MSLVTLAEVKAIGRIDYDTADTELQMLLDAAVSFVEEHCAIKLSSSTITDERMDGGSKQLWPKVLPVTAVSSVKDAWSDDEVVDSTSYFFTDTRIMADEDDYWAGGELRFKVTYTAGYTDETAPTGLKPLIIGLTLLSYANTTGKASERVSAGMASNWVQLAEDNNLIHQLDHFSLRRYME